VKSAGLAVLSLLKSVNDTGDEILVSVESFLEPRESMFFATTRLVSALVATTVRANAVIDMNFFIILLCFFVKILIIDVQR
jgi:hypothetical protein